MSKETIALLAALVGLATAILGLLNKTGVVDVPVFNQVPFLQPDQGGGKGGGGVDGGGGGVTFPEPATKVEVPNVVGLTEQAARDMLEESGLQAVTGLHVSTEVCSVPDGSVERTQPPAGFPVREGGTVSLIVCGG